MEKKQLAVICCTVAGLLFFSPKDVFAGNKSAIYFNITNNTILTSEGEFSRVSGGFNKPSFTVDSGSGEFSKPTGDFGKPSFSVANQTGEFSKPSENFGKPSFSISNNGEFSSFSLSLVN